MKILYIALESANWVVRLCNEMAKKGNDVVCLVQSSDDYEAGLEAEAHERLDVIRCSQEAIADVKIFQRDILPQISHIKFDVTFGSHVPVCPMVKALADAFKTPWGIMILDIPTDLMAKDKQRMSNWLYWFAHTQYADSMVFNTKVSRDEYHKYVNTYWPNVVTYGTHFIPEYKNSGIGVNGDYVLSICRLVDNKNCSLIPEALNLIQYPTKYIAVGRDGGELQSIRDKCKEYGIEFEHRANVTEKEKYELIRDCGALIYPQKTEYIGGLSPFEGMYVGKPVIVPRLKVLTDLYEGYPYYFTNCDASSLAEQISFAFNRNWDMHTDHLREGSDYAEKYAGYEQMADGLLKVMETMKNE